MIESQTGDTGNEKGEFRGGQALCVFQRWPPARGDTRAREWLGLGFLVFVPQTLLLDSFSFC